MPAAEQKSRALVTPAVLVWAREEAGFEREVVARKLSVKPERLAQWETGEARPTLPQLLNLSRVYKRNPAVFYLEHPPEEHLAVHDFRRPPEAPPRATAQDAPIYKRSPFWRLKGKENEMKIKLREVFADFKKIAEPSEVERVLDVVVGKRNFRLEVLYRFSNRNAPWEVRAYAMTARGPKCISNFPEVSERDEESAIRTALDFLQDRAPG